jgi:8-oxo-dGTP pyrophosphatase MutT (NUDIX family)
VHVTASAIVVTDDRRRVLLHLHKRMNMWLQPGGHIDAGELPWSAALREACEETGLPAQLVGPAGEDGPQLLHVDVHGGPKGHTHLDLRYLIESPQVPPTPPQGESQDVKWFLWHNAVDTAEAGLEGILRAVQPGDARIRIARHTDAVECAQVYLRSRAFALPTVPLVHADREVRRWMADEVVGRTDMWVAEVDGTIVALMVLDPGRSAGLDRTPLPRPCVDGPRPRRQAGAAGEGALPTWPAAVDVPGERAGPPLLRTPRLRRRGAHRGRRQRIAPRRPLRWTP